MIAPDQIGCFFRADLTFRGKAEMHSMASMRTSDAAMFFTDQVSMYFFIWEPPSTPVSHFKFPIRSMRLASSQSKLPPLS